MLPENMPGYRGPVVRSPPPADSLTPVSFGACDTPPEVDPAITPILTSINLACSGGHHFNLHVYPILMGHLTPLELKTCGHVSLYNHDTTVLVGELLRHSFVVYGFNTGHFASTSYRNHQTLDIVLAADSRRCGRAMFKQFTNCPQITDSATELLQIIQASSATSTIHGYWLHSHRFLHSSTELAFWKLQSAIIRALHAKRSLRVLLVHIHPECNMAIVDGFKRSISRVGWTLTLVDTSFPDFGDSVAGHATF